MRQKSIYLIHFAEKPFAAITIPPGGSAPYPQLEELDALGLEVEERAIDTALVGLRKPSLLTARAHSSRCRRLSSIFASQSTASYHNPLIRSWTCTPTAGAEHDQRA